MTELAPILGVLGGLVGVADTVPYVRDTVGGATRPHRGTWLIWGVLAVVACISQRAEGASWSLVLTGSRAILTGVVFVLAIPRGEGGVTAVDLSLIGVACAGVLGWILAREPTVAVVCVIVADLAAAAMMTPKTYRDPHSETLATYALASVAGALAAGAVGGLEVALLLYPAYYLLDDGAHLLREVAYASLAKAARARLHERHAAWLEGLGADLPEADARIGFHLEAASRYDHEVSGAVPAHLASAAGRRLAAAARVARSRGDLSGEVGFLDRAVALLGSDQQEGATLLPGLVAALIDAGESARAEELAQQAVATSTSLALPSVQARSTIERERLRLYRHPVGFDVPAATAVVEHASRALRARGDDSDLARTDYLMADLTWLLGDPVATYAHLERMLAHARRAQSGVDIASALVFMAWCLVEGPYPVPEAIARYELLAAETGDLRAVELSLLGCRAALTAMAGGYDDARGAMTEALAGVVEMRLTAISVYMAMLVGATASLAGDPASAERAVRDAQTLVSDPDDHWYQAMLQADLAHVMLAQDHLADAAAAIAELDVRPLPCDAEWVIRRHTARALLAARVGEPDRGLDDARAALTAVERTGLIMNRAYAHRTLAELLAATGEADAAAQELRRALTIYETKANAIGAAATRTQFTRLFASAPEK